MGGSGSESEEAPFEGITPRVFVGDRGSLRGVSTTHTSQLPDVGEGLQVRELFEDDDYEGCAPDGPLWAWCFPKRSRLPGFRKEKTECRVLTAAGSSSDGVGRVC